MNTTVSSNFQDSKMSDDDDAMALREIKWKALVLGQHQPTELAEGQEWTSQSRLNFFEIL